MADRRVVPVISRGDSFHFLSGSSKGSPTNVSSATSDPKLKRLADKLEGATDDYDEENIHTKIENFRMRLKRFMVVSYIGQLFQVTMLLLSILSVFEYIYTTYLSISKPLDYYQYEVLKVVELVVATFFAFDWSLSFFLADHKTIFLSSFYSMVDLMTVIPIYATYNEICSEFMTNQYDYTAYQIVNYVLCALNTTRILRALRIRRVIEQHLDDEVEQYLGYMALSVAVMILFSKSDRIVGYFLF